VLQSQCNGSSNICSLVSQWDAQSWGDWHVTTCVSQVYVNIILPVFSLAYLTLSPPIPFRLYTLPLV